jgi:hypothetical protein
VPLYIYIIKFQEKNLNLNTFLIHVVLFSPIPQYLGIHSVYSIFLIFRIFLCYLDGKGNTLSRSETSEVYKHLELPQLKYKYRTCYAPSLFR